MHLATAVGIPVVAVFGPSNHDAWGPWTAGHSHAEVVRMDLACSPCFYVGNGLGLRDGCPPRPCLTTLAADVVLAAAHRALDSHD
jgi:heptosyltransferase-2